MTGLTHKRHGGLGDDGARDMQDHVGFSTSEALDPTVFDVWLLAGSGGSDNEELMVTKDRQEWPAARFRRRLGFGPPRI